MRGWGIVCFVCWLWLVPEFARASHIVLRAPPECGSEAQVEREVAALLGREPADSVGPDFVVDVERTAAGRYKLLFTIAGAPQLSAVQRELEASDCAELMKMAVVAISMAAVEYTNEDERPTPEVASTASAKASPPVRRQESAPATAQATAPTEGRARPRRPRLHIVSVPGTPYATSERSPSRERPRVRAALGPRLAVDLGTLPQPGVGGELELALVYRVLQLSMLGGLFPSRAMELGDGRGQGDFGLRFGAVLGCGVIPFRASAKFSMLPCAGLEAGRLLAQGTDMFARAPAARTSWRAARVQLGFAWELTRWLRAVTDVGLLAPLTRPEFRVNEGAVVHQPRSVCGRFRLGLEIATPR